MRWQAVAVRFAGSVVLMVLVAALAVATGTTPVGADCSGPVLRFDRPTGAPGDVVVVDGERFADDCHDSGARRRPAPAKDLQLYVAQGEQVTRLARFDANLDFRFSVQMSLPAWLEPGTAGVRMTRQPQWGPFATIEITPPVRPVTGASVPPTTLPTDVGYCGTEAGTQSEWPDVVPVAVIGTLVGGGVLAARRAASRASFD